MKINLAEFLKEFTTELPEAVRAGEIYKLTYSSDMKNISFFAEFPAVIQVEDIFSFEHTMESALQIDSARLYPRYDEKLFGIGCYDTLIAMIKREVSVVNGFLNDAEARLDNDCLNIALKHSGRDILERCDFAGKLSQMIYNQFGKRVKICLNGGEPLSSSEFDQITNEIISQVIPDHTAQLIPEKTPEEIHRE